MQQDMFEKKEIAGNILQVVRHGDPILREVMPKFKFDGEYDPYQIRADYYVTCLASAGVGIAANQVGHRFRAFMMFDAEGNAQMCFNPTIVMASDEKVRMDEGCLSLPNLYAPIARPKEIRLRFQEVDGKFTTLVLSGQPSRVAQHEMDHLDGVDFLSRMTRYHRDQIRQKLKCAARREKRETANSRIKIAG